MHPIAMFRRFLLVSSLALLAFPVRPASSADELRPEWEVGQDQVAPDDLVVIPPQPAPETLTLSEAIELAFRHNAGFRQTVRSLLAARSDWSVARQRWALEVFGGIEKSGNGETTTASYAGTALSYAAITGADFSVSTELDRIDSDEDSRFLSAELRQPLLAGAGTASSSYEAVRRARNSYRAALLNFFEDRQGLIEQVISTYYNLAEQRDLVAIQDNSVTRAEQTVEDAEKRLEEKVTTILDVNRAKLRFSREQTAAVSQRQSYQDAMDRMLILLGLQVGGAPELVTDAPYLPQAPNTEALIATALEMRPDLRLADLSLEDRRATLGIARSQRLPDLDLFGRWSRERDGAEGRSWSVGLDLSVPIGSRALTESVRAARWSLLVSEQAREELRQRVIVEVRQQVRAAAAAQKNVEIAEQGLEVANKSAHAAQRLYEEGLGTNRDLLEAQDEITRSERQLTSSKINYYLALIRLKVAVGENVLPGEPAAPQEAKAPAPQTEESAESTLMVNESQS